MIRAKSEHRSYLHRFTIRESDEWPRWDIEMDGIPLKGVSAVELSLSRERFSEIKITFVTDAISGAAIANAEGKA